MALPPQAAQDGPDRVYHSVAASTICPVRMHHCKGRSLRLQKQSSMSKLLQCFNSCGAGKDDR